MNRNGGYKDALATETTATIDQQSESGSLNKVAIEFAPEIHEPMIVGVRVQERQAREEPGS